MVVVAECEYVLPTQCVIFCARLHAQEEESLLFRMRSLDSPDRARTIPWYHIQQHTEMCNGVIYNWLQCWPL